MLRPREALVVCSHLPGEGHFNPNRPKQYEVVPVECRDAWDYWAGLADQWESDRTIINVEHDIEVRGRHIDDLLGCPWPLCSWAYRCHWVSTGIAGGVIAAGLGARDRELNPEAKYLQGGEIAALWSAIGLVKIAPEARVGSLRREPWNWLELAVHDAVEGPWHMHWPEVNHHHW